ncbi:hypothetical protein BC826DRAFT_995122 [Russula brevipes]|nr:hypothetical protein BC826DRAFT_995122 [Russula brevipes]
MCARRHDVMASIEPRTTRWRGIRWTASQETRWVASRVPSCAKAPTQCGSRTYHMPPNRCSIGSVGTELVFVPGRCTKQPMTPERGEGDDGQGGQGGS